MLRSIAGVLLFGFALMSQAQIVNNLMPQPAELHAGNGLLHLTAALSVETPASHDERLQRAIDRAEWRFALKTGIPRSEAGSGSGTRLILRVAGPGEEVQSIREDESYSLRITTGGAEIDATGDVGAIHGLETFLQLIQPAESGYALPLLEIKDAPRFAWRGLLIDCGRHFEPVEVIKRTLDGMAAVKLNVFHWHLTEDQGFRIESKVYPELTAKGSDGQFYTQEQAREIVEYARDRGIRVVPEFEMPGHTTALLVAHSELASGTIPSEIRRAFGVSDYALDPTREETYTFLRGFLREMTSIFPDEYVHIGGDETPAPDWNSNPRIAAFKKEHGLKDNAALQAYFNTRVLAILTELHRRMIGWDEVLTPDLPADVAVQSWRGVASLGLSAKMGHDGILSQPYYLDGMRSAGDHYVADPAPSSANLTSAERRHILGGEVCMWGEQLNERTIDSRVWPRTAAIAERFWSREDVRDVNDMYRRLDVISLELEGLGVTHLQSRDAGLRALAESEQIDALRTFAAAFEPVSFHDRYQEQHTNALTPLDHFVDAVYPDPTSRHWIETLTERVLKDPAHDVSDRDALDGWFKRLSESVPEVQRQMQSAPRLREMSVRAQQTTELSAIARQALELLSAGKKAPAGWKEHATRTIAEAKRPSAIVRFIFIKQLGDLVGAVAE